MNAPEKSAPGTRAREREQDERCLALLMLQHDGREVEAADAAWAHAHLAAHPRCAAEWAALVEQAEALASAPPRRASPGFTARVLAQRRAGRAAGGDVLPFVRRLAVAAGLALAVTLLVEMAQPSDVQADAALQRQRHAADHFRSGAFGPQDIEAGLRGWLRDPRFGASAAEEAR